MPAKLRCGGAEVCFAVKLIASGVALGAFLLFQVQPLIGKYILPWFGGTPSVWTSAMVFFQVALLGGYWYAHLLTTRLTVRGQLVLHGTLLVVSLALLPIIPHDNLRPQSVETPTARILILLSATIGLPYLMLAATSPLLQAWSVTGEFTRRPYRLYALSNVASLLALITYPLVVEPWLGRDAQAWVWSVLFVCFALVVGGVGARVWRLGGEVARSRPATRRDTTRVLVLDRALWFAWSATGSVLLLAVTNEITQDVAVVPLFWVLPLSLYLLSFVIAFDRDGWYDRRIFMGALLPAIAGMVWMMFRAGTAPVVPLIAVFLVGLFVCCVVCHGELARLKPPPARLTDFYLSVAGGGALGGVFAAVLAPAVFSLFLELHTGIVSCVALMFITLARDPNSNLSGLRPTWAWALLGVAYVGLSVALTRHAALSQNAAVAKARNFYGVLTVLRLHGGTPDEHLALRNGMIDHGVQLTATERRRLPTTYYGHESGLGIAFRAYPEETDRRIGVVGLGVGTVAVYGRYGDTLRMYEINPSVTRMATEYFTYVNDSPAEVEIVHGDGRLSLERERPQGFDILVLDAFSGDAIPVHLLTREAFAIYKRHLEPDGVLVVNVSNRHVDITPVVRQHAAELNLEHVTVSNDDGPNAVWHSEWMLVTNNTPVLDEARRHTIGWSGMNSGDQTRIRPWTDDYANVLSVLRRSW